MNKTPPNKSKFSKDVVFKLSSEDKSKPDIEPVDESKVIHTSPRYVKEPYGCTIPVILLLIGLTILYGL